MWKGVLIYVYSTPFQIVLTQEDENALKKIQTKPSSEYREVKRASIILMAHQQKSNVQIAQKLGISVPTASKWRKRYCNSGLSGLCDAPRSGRKPVFLPEVKFEAMHIACTSPEQYLHGVTKWSYAKIAQVLVLTTIVKTISETRVQTWLKTMHVKPYKVKYYLKPKHPNFKTLMLEILKLYFDPPNDGPLLCVDEKTGIQIKEPLNPDKEIKVGLIARESQYKRHGTVCLLSAFEVSTGLVTSLVRSTHKTADFIELLKLLHSNYESNLTIHLILDNLSTHKSKELLHWLSNNK